jgi:hypothetical protein
MTEESPHRELMNELRVIRDTLVIIAGINALTLAAVIGFIVHLQGAK